MRETQLTTNFKREINAKCKQAGLPCFWYKIPDTKGLGGLRPFDGVLWLAGKTFAIEFKVGKNTTKPHQKFCLEQVKKTGNHSIVIRETDYKEVIDDIVKKACSARAIMTNYGNSYKNFKKT